MPDTSANTATNGSRGRTTRIPKSVSAYHSQSKNSSVVIAEVKRAQSTQRAQQITTKANVSPQDPLRSRSAVPAQLPQDVRNALNNPTELQHEIHKLILKYAESKSKKYAVLGKNQNNIIEKNNTQKLAQGLDQFGQKIASLLPHKKIHLNYVAENDGASQQKFFSEKKLTRIYQQRAVVDVGRTIASTSALSRGISETAREAAQMMTFVNDPALALISINSIGFFSDTLAQKYNARSELVYYLNDFKEYLKSPKKASPEQCLAHKKMMEAAFKNATLAQKIRRLIKAHNKQQETQAQTATSKMQVAACKKLEQHQAVAASAFARETVTQAASGSTRHVAEVAHITGSITQSTVNALNGVSAGIGVVGSGFAVHQAHAEYKRAKCSIKGMRAKIAGIDNLFQQDKKLAEGPLSEALKNCFIHHANRYIKEQKTEQKFSIGRGVHAGISGGISAAQVGVASAVGVGALTAGAAATGGIVLGMLVGGAAVTYAAGSGAKHHARSKAEHQSKWRQRRAQAIIKTHTSAQLRKLFEEQKKIEIWLGRGHYKKDGFTDMRIKEVDVANNEYIALHLLAEDFLSRAQGNDQGDRGAKACKILSSIGVDAHLLNDYFKLTQDNLVKLGEEKSLDQLKAMLAPHLGLVFRTDTKGNEFKPAPGIYWDAFRRVLKQVGETDEKFDDASVARKLFAQVPKKAFKEAANAIYQDAEKNGVLARSDRDDHPHIELLLKMKAVADYQEIATTKKIRRAA